MCASLQSSMRLSMSSSRSRSSDLRWAARRSIAPFDLKKILNASLKACVLGMGATGGWGEGRSQRGELGQRRAERGADADLHAEGVLIGHGHDLLGHDVIVEALG